MKHYLATLPLRIKVTLRALWHGVYLNEGCSGDIFVACGTGSKLTPQHLFENRYVKTWAEADAALAQWAKRQPKFWRLSGDNLKSLFPK